MQQENETDSDPHPPPSVLLISGLLQFFSLLCLILVLIVAFCFHSCPLPCSAFNAPLRENEMSLKLETR